VAVFVGNFIQVRILRKGNVIFIQSYWRLVFLSMT
jgi:hypothetical protein